MIAPPRFDHGQAPAGGHGPEPVGGEDLDVAAVADLCGPARAASDQAVEGSWLALEGQHDVKSTAGLQDACHLAKDLLWIFDVLKDVEDPDEVELAVAERQPLCGREPEINAIRRGAGRRDRRAARVAAEDLEVPSLAFDRLGHRARAAADVQHPAAHRGEVLEQIAKLQAVHEPGLGTQRARAPALGFVVEGSRRLLFSHFLRPTWRSTGSATRRANHAPGRATSAT